jgi:hypothetical protein
MGGMLSLLKKRITQASNLAVEHEPIVYARADDYTPAGNYSHKRDERAAFCQNDKNALMWEVEIMWLMMESMIVGPNFGTLVAISILSFS